MDFYLLEIWKSLATFKQEEEDGQGTVATKATGRCRWGDPAILTQSLPQVFLGPLAAFHFKFHLFCSGHGAGSQALYQTSQLSVELRCGNAPALPLPQPWHDVPFHLHVPRLWACHSQTARQQSWESKSRHSHWPKRFVSQQECNQYSKNLCPCPVCDHQSHVKLQLMYEGLPNRILAGKSEAASPSSQDSKFSSWNRKFSRRYCANHCSCSGVKNSCKCTSLGFPRLGWTQQIFWSSGTTHHHVIQCDCYPLIIGAVPNRMDHPKPSSIFSLAVVSSPIDLHLMFPFPHLNACSPQKHVDMRNHQQHRLPSCCFTHCSWQTAGLCFSGMSTQTSIRERGSVIGADRKDISPRSFKAGKIFWWQCTLSKGRAKCFICLPAAPIFLLKEFQFPWVKLDHPRMQLRSEAQRLNICWQIQEGGKQRQQQQGRDYKCSQSQAEESKQAQRMSMVPL